MQVVAYLDQAFWREGDTVTTRRSFVVFLGAVAEALGGMVLLGRLAPEEQRSEYEVPANLTFVALPWYRSAADPLDVGRAMVGSLRRFWRALEDADAVWLFGPQPVAIIFALAAWARGRRVVLGVRQNLPAYARHRHPGRRIVHLAADLLEAAFRLLARRCGVVVVGPDLARDYAAARRVLPASISLVRNADIMTLTQATSRSWDGPIRLLTVGRLDPEKNPLMLAELLARLRRDDDRWELIVCGDGPLQDQLATRLAELGVTDAAELRGHVRLEDGLLEAYRTSHAFVHVSWTEGVPQVLFEAFAAGLPVVATAVGGVEEAASGAALLVEPGQVEPLARHLERLAAEPDLRAGLQAAALERARAHTQEAEAATVAAFLEAAA